MVRPLASIGIDGSCYAELDPPSSIDLQGWHSDHPIFREVFEKHRPRLVCEIGTWKGASVLHMHSLARQIGLKTHFICIDTWLGSNDTLWLEPDLRAHLRLTAGYPDLFRQFVHNVRSSGAQDDISPFPITSTAAARVLRKLGVKFDALYIDAGHEEEEVYYDLALFYDLVVDGGAIFGDDYSPGWPGVVRAVHTFAHEKNLALKAGDGKFYFEKRPSLGRALLKPLRFVGRGGWSAARQARRMLGRIRQQLR
ncbi:MAG: class I SAM-dependent methyltransferase [Reyranella sp.]|jgi:predicted O-methyltransferase YrrM|nr:class I SAM-dependent methyltransferase [Reyranella sp.]